MTQLAGVPPIVDDARLVEPDVVAGRPAIFANRRVRETISVILGLAIWQVLADFVVRNPSFLPSPSAIGVRGWQMILDGSLVSNGWVSFQELVIGFVLGVAVGVAFGAAMVQWRVVNDASEIWISALYAAPMVALAPIIIIWFGVGTLSKVVVVFIMVVFPIVINTQAGLESVDRRLLTVARSFCANSWNTFRTVSLPSAAPFIVSGMRQAVGRALVGVVVGEFFGAKAGLGNIITTASSVFDMTTLFVCTTVLALAGVIFTAFLRSFELRLAAWRDVA